MMISSLSEASHMFAVEQKHYQQVKEKNLKSMRRSFYADQNINIGEKITNKKLSL